MIMSKKMVDRLKRNLNIVMGELEEGILKKSTWFECECGCHTYSIHQKDDILILVCQVCHEITKIEAKK